MLFAAVRLKETETRKRALLRLSQNQSMLRPTIIRPVLVSLPIWCPKPVFVTVRKLRVYRCRGTLTNERTGVSFIIAVGPRLHNHFCVRIPPDSWPYFTISISRFPLPVGPGHCIYNPQEQGAPVIPPDTAFPFRRLLQLPGVGWRY
jgi:hypothetical protein